MLSENNTKKGNISVICTCKNRSDSLKVALPSWLSKKEVAEIVIVNWDSSQKMDWVFKDDRDKKILLIEAIKEPQWELSRAYNLASRFTSKEKILKLDSDIILGEKFFDYHFLNDNFFFRGNEAKARNDNERYLNGVLFINKKDFFEANGYNEFINTYGEEDIDLYKRLEKGGVRSLNINNNYISHIEHQDEDRIKYQPGVLSPKDESIKNQLRLEKMQWTKKEKMSDFFIVAKMSDNKIIVKCKNKSVKRLSIKRKNKSVRYIRLKKTFRKISNRIDYIIGTMGIIINYFSPNIYSFLKKIKDRKDE